MLKLSEEIVLMALDENGSFAPMTEGSLEIAVAGALLIELSFMGRLDSDSVNMRVSDRSDTGSLALNKALDGAEAPSSKAPEKEVTALFEKAVPNYDPDRFYLSHMRKVLDWYSQLVKYASLDFVKEDEGESGEAAEA